jgi:hypothetical protein
MYVAIDLLPWQECLQFCRGVSKMVVCSLRLGPFCDKLRQVCPARDIRAWGGAQSHLWYSWYC